MSTPKYRPVLTAADIEHLLYLAKTEAPISGASIRIISILAPFQAKIENSGVSPAYIEKPKKPKVNSVEALGFSSSKPEPFPKEMEWEKAYIKYKSNPQSCSLSEISSAKEHMYLNELMTPEEAREFEIASTVQINIGEHNL